MTDLLDKELENIKCDDIVKQVEQGNERAKTKLAWLKLSGRGGAEIDEESLSDAPAVAQSTTAPEVNKADLSM